MKGFVDRVPCGSFRTLGIPYFGVLIVRIVLFRVLCSGPLFSETPMSPPVLKLSKSVIRSMAFEAAKPAQNYDSLLSSTMAQWILKVRI